MELTAALLLGLFFAGYFLLGGADIGLGMLLPYLGRDRAERDLVAAGFWPMFLANEVWLVAAAGVFIGCFPHLEGELFSGLLLVLVPVIAGWMIRDAGIWWRRQVPSAGDALIFVGSWLLALGWGWAVASLLSEHHDAPAPFAVGAPTAAAVALLFMTHGMGYAALRLTGRPFQRARMMAGHRAGGNSFALTSVVMAAMPVLAGAGLPLTEHAAGEESLRLLVPVLIAVLPLLIAAQAWLWRTFGGRAEPTDRAYF
ncbi:cytochrome d ubiquinol oxidase subunit II [Streptomyces sp. MP131-18]|uniref:cytochrome d ubiquinol oxidase subunit II n=1 Tax=Streptomyces sp. MP131-18 TaxID=1857892 RepID=UPI00097BFB73|nr:cytochrome d ubiquinol oxidase subunit II [Streptomyces sp. MP131-18]ONK13446.1 Cytochrome d ubiquinol oxidase subunit 2 [Streptomyces sp. MP131-18]